MSTKLHCKGKTDITIEPKQGNGLKKNYQK